MKLRVLYCLVEPLQSVLDIGGIKISLLQNLLRKTSKGPAKLSSIMEALVPFRVISIPCPLSPSLRLALCHAVLLYGCENWIVTERCLKRLDSFLGELAKRALKWPMHFSNTAAMTTLDVESVSSQLIIRKLSFLQRQLSHNAVGVGAKTMKSLVDGVDSLCLIKECRDLENISVPVH